MQELLSARKHANNYNCGVEVEYHFAAARHQTMFSYTGTAQARFIKPGYLCIARQRTGCWYALPHSLTIFPRHISIKIRCFAPTHKFKT